MTPREYKEYVEAEKEAKIARLKKQQEAWHVPLCANCKCTTLRDSLNLMNEFKLDSADVPLIIQLIENPKYNIEGCKIYAMYNNRQIILDRNNFKNIYFN